MISILDNNNVSSCSPFYYIYLNKRQNERRKKSVSLVELLLTLIALNFQLSAFIYQHYIRYTDKGGWIHTEKHFNQHFYLFTYSTAPNGSMSYLYFTEFDNDVIFGFSKDDALNKYTVKMLNNKS